MSAPLQPASKATPDSKKVSRVLSLSRVSFAEVVAELEEDEEEASSLEGEPASDGDHEEDGDRAVEVSLYCQAARAATAPYVRAPNSDRGIPKSSA